MVAAGLHGNARTESISHLHALKHFVCPWFSRPRLVDRLPLHCPSVLPASPTTPTSALIQAKAELRNLSSFIFSFVPAAPTAARTGSFLLSGAKALIAMAHAGSIP